MGIEIEYIAIFMVGLLGGVHCIGMCGGIVGALSVGLHHDSKNTSTRLFFFLLSYNAGRISSYVLVGMLVASISWLGSNLFTLHYLQQWLEMLAAVFMLALGLYLAGWWKGLLKIEQLGSKLIWVRLEPLGRKFIPVTTFPQAFMLGLVWGWLPCGLVYSVLIMTLTASGPLEGALVMLSFGLGTLPNLLLMGMFASTLNQFMWQNWVRKVVGLLIMLYAALMFYRALI